MKYKNLILVGTSHIAQESIAEIEGIISKTHPAVVALELDKGRLHALLHPSKRGMSIRDIFHIGLKGYLFSLLGAWAERKLGKSVGVMPGEEMKRAALLAKEKGIPVACIDQPIEKTLRRLSETITWKEKWRFFIDVLKSVFLKKQEFSFDLRKVPSRKLIAEMMDKVKERYPHAHHTLVAERNRFMARKIFHLMNQIKDKPLLAVVGAGHEDGIFALLNDPNVYIVPEPENGHATLG